LQTSTDKVQSGPFGRQDPSLPQVFGRYLLVQRLSRGGMGEIFLAKHGLAGFEKLAVIKKVLPHLAADAQFISRFVDEAQVAIKLQHVNVAQVFEVGRVGDEYFLALEYVEGRDLRRILAMLGHRKKRLPVDLALFIGRELANGLAYAHRRTDQNNVSLNLVHCDVSPPNVLVSFEGETKIIDFGIAKSALRGTATDPKMGFGKFGYMAPEQLIRGGNVDHRTDIYAAGVVLYELLTSQRLYEAGPEPDYRALAKKVARGDHPLPSEIDRVLAPYDDLVATALRPKSEDRYQSAAEFRDAIQQALVAVNPTISTDQLGLYMREAFSDEMTAQRELHDRVASAHLSDFHDAFHTQTISTVSFALAALPVPLADKPIERTPGSKKVTNTPTVSPAIDTQAPATAMMDSEDLSLADGTGMSPRESLTSLQARPKDRRAIFGVLAGLAIVLLGVVAFAALNNAKSQPAAASTEPKVKMTVRPLEPEPTKPAVEHKIVKEETPEVQPPPVDVKEKDPAKKPKIKRDRDKKDPKDNPKTPVVQPDPGITPDQLQNKVMQATREYREFKAKNGGRLEKDWGDLMTYVQYKKGNVEDRFRKVEEFRAKMKRE
jgi:serine/threonine protein kinase